MLIDIIVIPVWVVKENLNDLKGGPQIYSLWNCKERLTSYTRVLAHSPSHGRDETCPAVHDAMSRWKEGFAAMESN